MTAGEQVKPTVASTRIGIMEGGAVPIVCECLTCLCVNELADPYRCPSPDNGQAAAVSDSLASGSWPINLIGYVVMRKFKSRTVGLRCRWCWNCHQCGVAWIRALLALVHLETFVLMQTCAVRTETVRFFNWMLTDPVAMNSKHSACSSFSSAPFEAGLA